MERLRIELPRSWQDLKTGQLYYLYNLISENLSANQIKTYCLFQWGKIRVLSRAESGWLVSFEKNKYQVSNDSIAMAIKTLDWVAALPTIPVRISELRGYHAVDAMMQGVPFEIYIYCDNLYQGYLETQDHGLIVEMAEKLYSAEKLRLCKAEKLSIFYWWATLKTFFIAQFKNLFQEAENTNLLEQGASLGKQLQDAMNAQIRALTKGDITKEKEVLTMDTWRALTELDAQAREYNEMQKNYAKQ